MDSLLSKACGSLKNETEGTSSQKDEDEDEVSCEELSRLMWIRDFIQKDEDEVSCEELSRLMRIRDFISLLLTYRMKINEEGLLKSWLSSFPQWKDQLLSSYHDTVIEIDKPWRVLTEKALSCMKGFIPMEIINHIERGEASIFNHDDQTPEAILHLSIDLAVDQLIQTLLSRDSSAFYVRLFTRNVVEKKSVVNKIKAALDEKHNMFGIDKDFLRALWINASTYETDAEIRVEEEINMKVGGFFVTENNDMLHSQQRTEEETGINRHLVIVVDADNKRKLDLQKVCFPTGIVVVLITTEKDDDFRIACSMDLNIRTQDHLLPWEVFCSYVGSSTILSSMGIQRIAVEIVKECHGHLLATVLVAKYLKNVEDLKHWEVALDKLSSLNSSYDYEGSDQICISRVMVNAFLNITWESIDDTQKLCLELSLFVHNIKIGVRDDILVSDWEKIILGYTQELGEYRRQLQYYIEDLQDRFVLFKDERGDVYLPIETYDIIKSLHTSKPSIIRHGALGLTEPPDIEQWHSLIQIELMDNQICELPQSPNCPKLKVLLLQGNVDLMDISDSFFNHMPLLQHLDLSYTSIRDLPPSVSKLIQLKKFYLRGCDLFMELPPQIGQLKNLKELDLDGTLITHLSKEIGELINLQSLTLCFDAYHHGKKGKQISKSTIIPPGLISNLTQLKYLSINVDPEDEQWNEDVNRVLVEIFGLERLETVSIYVPEAELLELIPAQISLSFRLVVGHHLQRFISRVTPMVEQEFKRCGYSLKFVNGVGVPIGVKMNLEHFKALYLDRHMTIKSLSDFELRNLCGLEVCILAECNKMETIVDGGNLHDGPVLSNLEFLSAFYMKNLRSICEGPNPSFLHLKSIALHTCPMLTTVFTIDSLQNLSSLEVIIIEDCPKLTTLISHDNSPKQKTYFVLPSLSRISLLYLPKLVNIFNGLHVGHVLEEMVFYYCPKLQSLSKSELSSKYLNVIQGESMWWEALKWNAAEWGDAGVPKFFEHIFSPINEEDTMNHLAAHEETQLNEYHNTRYQRISSSTQSIAKSSLETPVSSPLAPVSVLGSSKGEAQTQEVITERKIVQAVPKKAIDINQIILEAQHRWLRPAEICEILSNHKKFRIAPEPAHMPPSGSLFLFDRKVLRYFRKDGHNWRKKKDGKTVREAHERLKAGSVDVLHCYYAHGEENESFQRRTYWMLEEELSHIVLVHYRQVKGTKANFTCAKESEESLPYAQQTDKIMPKTEMDTSLSSTLHPHSYQVPSQTMDTSMNSGQASEYEEAESAFNNHASSEFCSSLKLQCPVEKITPQPADSYSPQPLMNDQEKLPVIPGVNYISLTQDNKIKDIHNVGLTYESPKSLGFSSWEGILENNAGSQHVPFQPLFPGTLPGNMGINSNFSQGDEIMVPYLTTSIAKQHENGSVIQAEGNWQVLCTSKIGTSSASGTHLLQYLVLNNYPGSAVCGSFDKAYDVDSLRVSSWPIDSAYPGSTCEVSCSNCEQEVDEVDFQKSLEQCPLHQHKQNKVLMQNDPQEKLLNDKEKIKSDLEANRILDGIEDTYVSLKRTLLDGSPAGEGLKKNDSFNQWMSKELGDVEESNKPSTSGGYWDTVESKNEVGNTTIPSQGHLDTYVLDPSVSDDQLFSIIDYSPSWAFEGSEIKVIISGRFLRSQHEAEQCKWSCMFGKVEVPAEIIAKGVLCCHTPPHMAGRVPFYVTCSNRLACSEVREFDFQVCYIGEVNTAGENRDNTFDTFSIRFGKLLSLGHAFPQNSDSISVSEKSQLRSKISSLLREEEEKDDWDKLLKLTLEKDFSPENLQEELLQNLLKDNLHAWLLQKITEEGKGPNVLDEGGQGVLHFAAALGYDWALEPTIVAGVNVNFRDVNGWTALHWAAFCGRERTVAFLISLGAAPGLVTDPCPEHPSGRTPADLAHANGHKGIAGYLAESSLSAHLTTLDLNRDTGENSGANVVQRLQNLAQVNDLDNLSDEPSLKDSLAAVCNATQAAARIHQVFRMQSFQRKQLKEYDDDKLGMSDERALSLLKMNVKSHKSGPRDEPVHAAAIRIQNKFRSWKGRREFLMIRQRIVKIQAHVRGHQVRKSCGKIIWSVGILEKVILRWRRKGSGLRGFKSEANSEATMIEDVPSTEDDYDFLKEGRKQTEQRLQKALARVKSMVQYQEARDQYHRLLNVVTEIQETQVKNESTSNNSEEPRELSDLIDLEALLDEDIFMPTLT